MRAQTIEAEVDRHLAMMEGIRARVLSAGSATAGWRVTLCTGLNDYLLQFQRGHTPSGAPDLSLDARGLARALARRWARLGGNYEGSLDGMPAVRVVIHQAEPRVGEVALVEL